MKATPYNGHDCINTGHYSAEWTGMKRNSFVTLFIERNRPNMYATTHTPAKCRIVH